MKSKIQKVFADTARLHEELREYAPQIEEMLHSVIGKMRSGATLYAMGNGGSAADAQHVAGELVGRFLKERKALPCVALTTDSSVMTSLANDYGTEAIFARQVQALVKHDDVVLALSTSGNSPNILEALELSKELGALNVGLSGKTGGEMLKLCDHCICVPHVETPRIQEAHQTLVHIICEFIEQEVRLEE